MDLILLLYTKEVYTDLDDDKTVKNKYGNYFKNLDERYQLELIYEVFEIEKIRRKVNSMLKTTLLNSTCHVNDLRVENIFEAEPDISCEKLIRTYQNK